MVNSDSASSETLELAEHWDSQAENWTKWARLAEFDSYWRFHGAVFHELIDEAGLPGRALDLGCGEGRVARRLSADGWAVDAVDVGPRLCAAARGSGLGRVLCASAAALSVRSRCYDLVSVFMALHDFDESIFELALDEISRVVRPGGSVVVAVNHPVHSMLRSVRSSSPAAEFGDDQVAQPATRLEVRHSYFVPATYETPVSRGGETFVFKGVQRPLERYVNGFLRRGLCLARMREVGTPPIPAPGEEPTASPTASSTWSNVPLFVDLRFHRPDE
jgi:SAM-dependent methyltransferase